MTDHTPTTELDHEDWSELDYALRDVGPIFDRWLADHNRKVAAKTLREYVERGDFETFYGPEMGGLRATFQAAMAGDILSYADRIEQGDDDV